MPTQASALPPGSIDREAGVAATLDRRHLRRVMAVVGLLVSAMAMFAIPARAGYGAQTLADEPQYLLAAGSLYHQRSLDIADDLAAERYRTYYRGELPQQTAPRADGRQISPHDPLLPAILAVPIGLGGWVAAKVTLSMIAGALAALLVWTAVRRFRVPIPIAAVVVGAFGVVPPLVSYGSQVYPELPAAFAVAVAAAGVTGPLDRRGRWTALAAIVALPWLAVKYAPVAAALAGVLLFAVRSRNRPGPLPDPAGSNEAADRPAPSARLGQSGHPARGTGRDRPGAAALVVVLAGAGLAYLLVHRAVYGGWTVYAAGDHFTGGELTVVGTAPDYPARALRLVGLLTDHDFGLLAWAPAYILVIPALAALARRRPPGTVVLVLPLAAGWLNATFVALTMHGWWWPGRQVVVVLPLAILAVAWWAPTMSTAVERFRLRRGLLALTTLGVLSWAWLLGEVVAGGRALIIDFAQTSNPASKAWRLLLPDDRVLAPIDLVRQGAWIVGLAVLATWAWRQAAPSTEQSPWPEPSNSRPLLTHHVPERTPV